MKRVISVQTGHEIELLQEISKGGEGTIHKTNNDSFVAKIYGSVSQEQIEKLQMMLKNKPEDPTLKQGHISIAWICDLLKDSNGQYVGFLMPAIERGETLNHVYHFLPRPKEFTWDYLHVTAANVALIVKSLHAKNYVIGDIKPENLLVNNQAQVSIIDTDSFQIRDPLTGKIYRSPVSSSEFTPVESMGKVLKDSDRLEPHDRFALAVIIYLLLFGENPFSGGKWLVETGDPPRIDERVQNGHWLHAPNAPLKPTPRSMPMEIVHPKIQACFRRCFDDGHKNPNARPSAEEWHQALVEAYKDLMTCKDNRAHRFARSYGKCYWCLRQQQLGFDIFPGSVPQKIGRAHV